MTPASFEQRIAELAETALDEFMEHRPIQRGQRITTFEYGYIAGARAALQLMQAQEFPLDEFAKWRCENIGLNCEKCARWAWARALMGSGS